MLVVGIEKINYIRKKDNSEVHGIKIHCTAADPNNTGLDGVRCESFYISGNKMPDISSLEHLEVGMEIRISYNRFGGVDDIIII